MIVLVKKGDAALAKIVSDLNTTMALMELRERQGLVEPAAPAAASVRACRFCGCTNDRACFSATTGLTCWWVEDDLCSFCLGAAVRQEKDRSGSSSRCSGGSKG